MEAVGDQFKVERREDGVYVKRQRWIENGAGSMPPRRLLLVLEKP